MPNADTIPRSCRQLGHWWAWKVQINTKSSPSVARSAFLNVLAAIGGGSEPLWSKRCQAGLPNIGPISDLRCCAALARVGRYVILPPLKPKRLAHGEAIENSNRTEPNRRGQQ